MVNFLTYQEYTTITNISTAAMTVLPLPNPGARLSLEISEPLGLHMPSRKTTKDNCNNMNYNRDQVLASNLSVSIIGCADSVEGKTN